MSRKRILLISAPILLLAVVLLVVLLAPRKSKSVIRQFKLPEGSGEKIGLSTTRPVKLFFFTDSSPLMVPVDRELEIPTLREETYKRFIDLLLQGAEGYTTPVPENTSLAAAYFLRENGVLVLDWSENVRSFFPGGSAAEQEFVYFIVDNVCFNFREVKKVVFLFGGNEQKELSGHLDMERAYYPDFTRLGQQ